jgi:F-type H+-transporting ATPase subunit gamma
MQKSSLKKLRQRLKFLNNFQKMTKTLSLISSVKYKKYYQQISEIINVIFYLLLIFKELLRRNPKVKQHLPSNFLTPQDKKTLIIAITSDRGLAGAFDLSIFEATNNLINSLKRENKEFLLGVIGKKGETYFSKRYKLLFSFSKLESVSAENFAEELISYLRFLIDKGELSEIIFVQPILSLSSYKIEKTKVFPLDFESLKILINKFVYQTKILKIMKKTVKKKRFFQYILEPSPKKIAEVIFENVWYSLIYIIILISQASLEMARTITMKRAEENANELKSETILIYNKLRQNKITQDILDITRI